MKRVILFGLLLAATSAFAFEADDADLEMVNRQNPPGNYYQTCNACDWEGDFFHCLCDPVQGRPVYTGLYYNQECKYHTLQNINGHLRCDP